jgi:hypothetical protein
MGRDFYRVKNSLFFFPLAHEYWQFVELNYNIKCNMMLRCGIKRNTVLFKDIPTWRILEEQKG